MSGKTNTISRPGGWTLLRRNRAAMISLWFLAALSLLAIVGPMLMPDSLKSTGGGMFERPLTGRIERAGCGN